MNNLITEFEKEIIKNQINNDEFSLYSLFIIIENIHDVGNINKEYNDTICTLLFNQYKYYLIKNFYNKYKNDKELDIKFDDFEFLENQLKRVKNHSILYLYYETDKKLNWAIDNDSIEYSKYFISETMLLKILRELFSYFYFNEGLTYKSSLNKVREFINEISIIQ